MTLHHSTFRAEGCGERKSMPDTESVEHTTVSFNFDVEASDSLGGYVRPLHVDVAIRTTACSH